MRRISALLILTLISLCLSTSILSASDADLLKNLSLKNSKKAVLNNGLVVILKEAPPSGLVSLDVRVRAGSAYEGNLSGSGVSHLVEHMVFKGTPRKRPGEIEKKIRSLGGTINGATSFDYTSFTITVPKEHLSGALDILSDSLFNASINPAEMNKEKNVILKEIRLNRDDPMRYISRLLWSSVFTVHPYRHPVIGYEPLFRKLTREDVLRYYKRMYIPNNMVLVLVGDIERDIALAEVKKYFQHRERTSFVESVLPQEKPQLSKRTLDVEKELQMAYFALGYHSVDVFSPDMAALDVLSTILGGGESSRLNSNIYRKKNLVYSVGSWNYTPRDPGLFIISGVTEPNKLKPALGAIKEEINNIKRGGVDEHELQRAKTMITANYLYALENLADQARDLATNEIMTGDFNFTEGYLKAINSVTQDDVKKVATLYLNDNLLSVVTLSPQSEEILTKEEKEKGLQRDIQKFTLPNGLKCLLMEDHNIPTVSMVVTCLGGLRAETKKNSGISNLTGLMMLKGTTSKSEEEILDTVETMGASLSFFSGNNSLGIRFNLLSKDMDKGLDLLEDIIVNPSFPDEILQWEKDVVVASIEAIDDNIFNAGLKTFKETLFKSHSYRFQVNGNIDSVDKITREDLEQFHKSYFISNNMVLAIFGDIDSKELKEKIHEKFSSLQKAKTPKFTSVTEPEQVSIRQDSSPMQKEQSMVIMGFKGATIKDKDRYILQLISTSLSGISGRLSARLRERRGLAYSLGSFSVPALDPGYFALYISTTRDNIEHAKKEFIRQIIILNKKGLTDQEIASAKKELIGNQRIALQTNTSLVHHTALDELYGLGYDYYLKYAEIINSITNEDIINISRKYLKPNAYTLIVIEGK